jgi:hypothetical protein
VRTRRSESAGGARRAQRITGLAVAATAILIVVTVSIIAVAPDAPLRQAWGFRGFAAILAVAFGAVGALVSLRVPGNRIGALLVAIGLSAAIVAFAVEYAAYGLVVAPGSVPLALPVGWLVTWVWVPFAGLATTFLLLLFPDGHLPSPAWRPAVRLATASIVLTSTGLALQPGPIDNAPYLDNPLEIPGAWASAVEAMTTFGFGLLAVAVLVSAGSLAQRFRRSTGAARQQLKWFAAAAVFAGVTLAGPGTLLNIVVSGSPATSTVKAFEILTILSFLSIPVATGIAVLRYHLYEIDRLISRTIGWAIVTGLLVGTFVLLVLGLTSFVEPLTGGNTLVIAGSTLVVAALFNPVRTRVQRAVDRRFDRSRYDGERLLAAFGERLRDEVDLAAISADVLATVDAAVRPSAAGLWLRERDGGGT